MSILGNAWLFVALALPMSGCLLMGDSGEANRLSRDADETEDMGAPDIADMSGQDLGCGVDERVESGACVPCDPDTTRPAGDDPSGPDTTCAAAGSCAQDMYVLDFECAPCPPGTQNAAGDDPAGADTSCDAVLCGENEYVEDNACVPCEGTATNAAGDDASGVDTMCDLSACGVDEYVSSNACMTCPLGTTNAEGDDPSGADTLCDDPCIEPLGIYCSEITTTYVKASNTGERDRFGHAVAIDGDIMVVGVPYEDSDSTGVNGAQNDGSDNTGAVYVFERDSGTGIWGQQAYLKASNAQAGDSFGWDVAVDGDTLVVGAVGESSGASGVNGDQGDNELRGSGAVYVFVRGTLGVWSQQAYLKASNPGQTDQFGESVDVSGDRVVVGTSWESSDGRGVDADQNNDRANRSGAAYVFARSGGTWRQQAYLKASNANSSDEFGRDVAIAGDTVVVGASKEDGDATGVNGDGGNDRAGRSGAAYVFAIDRLGVWNQQAYLKASNTNSGDQFGWSVDIDGDTVAVGAIYEQSKAARVNGDQGDNSLTNAGAVYVFTRNASRVWSQQAYVKPSVAQRDLELGHAVKVDGSRLLVGAPSEHGDGVGVGSTPGAVLDGAGAAYLFERDGAGVWRQLAYVKAPNTGLEDRFGASVALSGDTLTIGADQERSDASGINGDPQDDTLVGAGAVYTVELGRP